MNKVAIILTTFKRPALLKQCLQSIITYWPNNIECVLLVGNQCLERNNLLIDETYHIINDFILQNPNKQIKHIQLPYDCGIAFARNELIKRSNLLDCKYTLLMADSICVNESFQNIRFIISQIEEQGYDLVGLELQNRVNWEGWLTLNKKEKVFKLDFIDPKEKENQLLVPCSIVRNFWIAKTESLIQVPYDNDLIMCEHEDFFIRYKQARYKVCCTNFCSGTYKKQENIVEYDTIRSNNFRIGKQRLLNKYSLKKWIEYKHSERIIQP